MPPKRTKRIKKRGRKPTWKKMLFQYRGKNRRYNKKRTRKIRKTKLQSKVHRRLNKYSKYASTNANQIYPMKSATILNTQATSYTHPQALYFPDIRNRLSSSQLEMKPTSYARQLVLNSTNYLLSDAYDPAEIPRQPVDRQQPFKLSPYKQMRINGCNVTITFQIFGNFDGHVWALPGIVGKGPGLDPTASTYPEQTTGNCTNDGYISRIDSQGNREFLNSPTTVTWSRPVCQFHNGVVTQYKQMDDGTYIPFGNDTSSAFYPADVFKMQPNVTEENMALQKSIKYRKIVRQGYGGASAPKTVSLSFRLKFRDMDLTLKTQQDYNNKYGFYDIESSNEHGYTFPRNFGKYNNNAAYSNQVFNLAFGILPSVAQTTPVYARCGIRMRQFVELSEPFRQKYGTDHPIV